MLVADHLPVGTQRRVAVACKFMNCGQLLVLHDALFGVNEGDGLAVLKALSDMCRSALKSCKACYNDVLHQCVYHCKTTCVRRQARCNVLACWSSVIHNCNQGLLSLNYKLSSVKLGSDTPLNAKLGLDSLQQ